MTSFVGQPEAERLQGKISTTTLTALIKQFPCVKAFVHSEQCGTTVEPNSQDRNADGASQNAINEAGLDRIIRARRRRSDFLPSEFFGEPAWDMLLDLARASIGNTRVSVSSLAIASAVPSTTALRWIHILEKTAFLEREADPTDGRRVYVNITESGRDAMNAYFWEIGDSPLVL